jgi:hypothetical protein
VTSPDVSGGQESGCCANAIQLMENRALDELEH